MSNILGEEKKRGHRRRRERTRQEEKEREEYRKQKSEIRPVTFMKYLQFLNSWVSLGYHPGHR